jgi:antibiotic biosynthesis monooxygenase (ABM) superfamily enzyme
MAPNPKPETQQQQETTPPTSSSSNTNNDNDDNLESMEDGLVKNQTTSSSSLPYATPAIELRISQCPRDAQHPITVLAKHTLKVGAEVGFAKWVEDITIAQQSSYPGYLGSEVIRPMNSGDREYISIFRYDTYEHLKSWMTSDLRDTLIHQVQEYLETPVLVTYHSLEHWFVPPSTIPIDNHNANDDDNDDAAAAAVAGPPPKYKMVVVVFLVIWFQVHFINPNTIGKITALSPLGQESLGTLLIVILTTYVFMPIATRLLAFWLFPTTGRRRDYTYLATLQEWISRILLPKGSSSSNAKNNKKNDKEKSSAMTIDKTTLY